MNQPDFFWGYLPFWIVNYGLSLVAWACIGRWMLSFFVPALQPGNYIWRSFVWLTGWAIAAVGFVTPASLGQRWLPLITAFWLFWLRTGFYFAMAAADMTPRLAGGG
jgi:hypothetical protein